MSEQARVAKVFIAMCFGYFGKGPTEAIALANLQKEAGKKAAKNRIVYASDDPAFDVGAHGEIIWRHGYDRWIVERYGKMTERDE